MGYHRDGELLAINPFETEMRRRIWWQIARTESRLAITLGYRHTLLPSHWDTKPPRNINDAEIFPDQREPVRARNGPTEMGFVLLLNEVHRHFISADAIDLIPVPDILVPRGRPYQSGRQEADQNNITAETARSDATSRARSLVNALEELESTYVDASAGVVHRAALVIRPLFTHKLHDLLLPLEDHPEWGTEIQHSTDLFFKGSVAVLEAVVDSYEALNTCGFGWLMKLNLMTDASIALGKQLCQRPFGSLPDRAWQALSKLYGLDPALSVLSNKDSLIQARLLHHAWKMRSLSWGTLGLRLDMPWFIAGLERSLATLYDASGMSSKVERTLDDLGTLDAPPLNLSDFTGVGNSYGFDKELLPDLAMSQLFRGG